MQIARFAALSLAGALISISVDADATPLLQYANSVIGYSSEYSPTSWSAAQTLGAPNTMSYGDLQTAWAPRVENGSLEFLSLGFLTPVYATGAMVRETFGNGFVYRIDAIDTAGQLHKVWNGVDTSQPGSPVNFAVSWAPTSYLVAGLKIYADTNHNMNAWEEIDAVQLAGTTAPVPEPAPVMLMAGGLGLLGFARRRVGRRPASRSI